MTAERLSQYTKLSHSKNGIFYGRCPFCHAPEESFKVNDKNGTFICYVCGAKGTEKEFYSKITPVFDVPEAKIDQTVLDIYEDAAIFYFKKLHNEDNPGMKYLQGTRKMNKNETMLFGLGYAPDKYKALYSELSEKYPENVLLKSGLFRKTSNGFINDFFRNRVMFPILNKNGDVIAFGGRALIDDSGSKYLNSPETDLFSKRKTLFGYPYSLKKRNESLIVCEGYMDCITLQNAGFFDSCAVLGTALTEEHAKLIGQSYRKVILSLDSDQAGINAAKKSIKILEYAGITVKILNLKPAKDPDEFLKCFSKDNLTERLKNAMDPDRFIAQNSDINALIDILLKQE